MTTNKKYYILYKVVRDAQSNIIDIEYLNEFNNYNDIQAYTKIHKTNIKTMINKTFNNHLKVFKDLTIIKE